MMPGAIKPGSRKRVLSVRILGYNLPANYVDQQNQILAKLTKAVVDAMVKKMITSRPNEYPAGR